VYNAAARRFTLKEFSKNCRLTAIIPEIKQPTPELYFMRTHEIKDCRHFQGIRRPYPLEMPGKLPFSGKVPPY